jgi:hypothetical protein
VPQLPLLWRALPWSVNPQTLGLPAVRCVVGTCRLHALPSLSACVALASPGACACASATPALLSAPSASILRHSYQLPVFVATPACRHVLLVCPSVGSASEANVWLCDDLRPLRCGESVLVLFGGSLVDSEDEVWLRSSVDPALILIMPWRAYRLLPALCFCPFHNPFRDPFRNPSAPRETDAVRIKLGIPNHQQQRTFEVTMSRVRGIFSRPGAHAAGLRRLQHSALLETLNPNKCIIMATATFHTTGTEKGLPAERHHSG